MVAQRVSEDGRSYAVSMHHTARIKHRSSIMHPYQGDSCPSKRATHISRSFVAFRTRITHGAVDRVAGRSHDETFKLLGLQELDARHRAVHLN